MASDRVAAAVAELYGVDPDAFMERRKALVAAAREAGDREAAAAIGALRKPTQAAWVVNRLARAEPSAADRMAALAAELRAAEAAKDGRRLRELSAARGSLLDGLVAQALAAAGTPDPPAGLRAEVTATLTAALADPETAAGFAAGTLTRAAQWSGFGYADLGAAGESAPDADGSPAAAEPAPVDIATRRSRRAHGTANSDVDAAQPAAQKRQQQRQAAEEQRLAREAAERTARAREKFEDAERTVALTSAAAAEAAAAEDQLEAEVRDLEGRVTQAREDLAAARRRARHAEATERRARQILDRMAHP